MDKLEEISRILPCAIRQLIKEMDIDTELMQEIRLRAEKPCVLVYDNREYFLSTAGKMSSRLSEAYVVNKSELKETFELLSEFSTYAYEEEIKLGYITIHGGHRVGIAGKAIVENGMVKNLKHVSFINIRVAHEKIGCANNVMKYIRNGDMYYHTLIMSPPRAGKTTLLRDIIRQISNGSEHVRGCNVGVVDERSEICACYRGIAQNDVGIRTDVIDGCSKAEGMMRLVRSMSPEVIAVDEIGTEEDYEAIRYVMTSGCSVIATVHADDINKAIKDGYFQRYILINNRPHGNRQVKVYDEYGKVLTNGA